MRRSLLGTAGAEKLCALGEAARAGVVSKVTRLQLGQALLALVVILALHSTESIADAKLLNFDSHGRVPGSFYVIFRTDTELAAIPHTGPNAPKVLPNLALTSGDAVARLAAALCAEIHAELAGVNYVPPHKAFITRGASDVAMREVLAKDPRIAEIGANIELRP